VSPEDAARMLEEGVTGLASGGGGGGGEEGGGVEGAWEEAPSTAPPPNALLSALLGEGAPDSAARDAPLPLPPGSDVGVALRAAAYLRRGLGGVAWAVGLWGAVGRAASRGGTRLLAVCAPAGGNTLLRASGAGGAGPLLLAGPIPLEAAFCAAELLLLMELSACLVQRVRAALADGDGGGAVGAGHGSDDEEEADVDDASSVASSSVASSSSTSASSSSASSSASSTSSSAAALDDRMGAAGAEEGVRRERALRALCGDITEALAGYTLLVRHSGALLAALGAPVLRTLHPRALLAPLLTRALLPAMGRVGALCAGLRGALEGQPHGATRGALAACAASAAGAAADAFSALTAPLRGAGAAAAEPERAAAAKEAEALAAAWRNVSI